jgi:Uma2 family endonuclease
MVAEILEGELIASPRPASPHARAALNISLDLAGPFDRSRGGSGNAGGWWFLAEPELHLHGDIVVPDVAGWRRERMPRLPSVAAFELPPDWVCEVLSPRTARHDRRQKMRIYARETVPYLWFVEPVERTLEVYRLEGTRWSTAGAFGDTDKVRAEPFAEIELDLSRWWLPDEPVAP